MPFITCKVNRPVSRAQETELKTRMGRAIELVPGKSEQSLLLVFEPESRPWLRGDDKQPAAYIDAAVFGNEGHSGYPEFTAKVTRAFGDVLGIRPENVYIRGDRCLGRKRAIHRQKLFSMMDQIAPYPMAIDQRVMRSRMTESTGRLYE